MEGLQELRVELRMTVAWTLDEFSSWILMAADPYNTDAAVLVERIRRFATPRVFELSVPFACNPFEPWCSLPCRIRRGKKEKRNIY